MKSKSHILAVLLLGGLFTSLCHAEVRVSALFSVHMVLQRDIPVCIFGTASANEDVTVKFRDQTKSASADKDGKWLVKLDPLKAGGPDTLRIGNITLQDVLVGEVWLGSGQSNMDYAVPPFASADALLVKNAAQNYPRLRLLRYANGGRKGWTEATPDNNTAFSALLLSFGIPLQKNLDVPVGLVVSAVSGTPSSRWLSKDMLFADLACKQEIESYAAAHPQEQLQAEYETAQAKWEAAAAAAKSAGKPAPPAPGKPAKPGETDGGTTGDLYSVHIRPLIPFTFRGVLWDQGEAGTALAGVDQYTLMGALFSGWRNAWATAASTPAELRDFPFIYVQKPSGFGCAFDTSDPINAGAYPFGPLPPTPYPTSHGLLAETYVRMLAYPNTAMVTTSDLVPGGHPPLKSSYGSRAARVALGYVYARPVEIYGPLYKTYKIEDGKIRITFTHTGRGLAVRHAEKLQGFSIAGDDQVFHWADASIDGDTVLVSSPAVPKPIAVRYAWAMWAAPWANLFNMDGLPALTFRTDRW
jgi:sialate O-acetylesterase